MSSTTRLTSQTDRSQRHHRRDRQRGQILVIFAGGLVAFLAIAALVYDVGQNLFDWRAQRDAADAAALAGSRYIADATCYDSPSIGSCPDAANAALHVAELNGYGDGATNCAPPASGKGEVCVLIPPQNGDPSYRQKGFLEVDIHTDRPSFFALVLGVLRQSVDALAVAGNSSDVAPPYSMLALRSDCGPGIDVGGGGTVTVVNGSVVSNSTCNSIWTHGGGSLTAPECDAVGDVVGNPPPDPNCTSTVEGYSGEGDPLGGLQPPPKPADPPSPVTVLLWNGGGVVTQAIPTGCPSSTAIEVVTDVSNNPSVASTNASSVALPYFRPGDLAIVHAYRNNNDAPPTAPTGWITVPGATGGGNGNSADVGYRFLVNGDTTTGTWTNASAIQVIIVQGVDAAPIGAAAFSGSVGATMTTPALSLQVSNQTSWVVAFAGSNATNANVTSIPADSGQPTPTTRSGAIGALALHTGEGVSAWTSRDYSPTTNGTANWTAAVEVKAALPSTSTAANPIGCAFKGGKSGTYNVYRIHPGVYYGGIRLNGAVRVYMEPGTYWLAGGGLDIGGTGAQLISDSGGTGFVWPANPPAPGRGVLIYNTEDSGYCGIPIGSPCIGTINANGGSDSGCTDATTRWRTPDYPTTDPSLKCTWLHLEPNDSPYKNLLMFVDRNLTAGITFNGSTGKIDLGGTIYDPNGEVTINGSADDAVAAQIIAYNFKITGSSDGFTITYNADGVFHLKGVGLVQ